MKYLFVLIVAFFLIMPVVSAQEGCEEGARRICGSDVGVCETGRSICKDGKWGECKDNKKPTSYKDECGNSLDDDCDGETDENCFPWVSLVLVGMGFLFIGLGLLYMQRGKGEGMISEGLAKD